MKKLLFILATTLFSTTNASFTDPTKTFGPLDPTGGVTEIPYSKTAPAMDFPIDDLKPMGDLVGKSKVVGLGEPIHGTHEFHTARVRFIKYLVEKKNYRFIAFESPWYATLETNNYVSTCQGDPAAALRGLTFAAWMDSSVYEMLKWACEFNSKNPNDKVVVLGFDMQQPDIDKQFIMSFLKLVDPGLAISISSKIEKCLEFSPDMSVSIPDYRACKQALFQAKVNVDLKKASYLKKTSKQHLFLAKLSIDTLSAAQDEILHSNSNYILSYEARDLGMYQTFIKLRDFFAKGKKSILYAHNFHLAKNTKHDSYYGPKSMGSILDENDPSYFVFAGIGYKVETNKKYFPGYPDLAIPTAENSVEKKLHDSQSRFSIVNTRGSFLIKGKHYQMQDQVMPYETIPSRHYDGLIFIDHSGPLIFK